MGVNSEMLHLLCKCDGEETGKFEHVMSIGVCYDDFGKHQF